MGHRCFRYSGMGPRRVNYVCQGLLATNMLLALAASLLFGQEHCKAILPDVTPLSSRFLSMRALCCC